MAAHKQDSPVALMLIGLFKLAKGIALLIVAIGALRLLHKDVAELAMHWIDYFRVDPDNRFIHGLIVHALGIHEKQLKEISAGTFFYSGILLTEGIGLLMKKHWAEYFTVISTAVFIPLEIYEIHRRFTWVRVWVLIINVAIVWYLVNRIRKH